MFDFNDEPGLLYFLLGRVPGTRFYNVSMAITAYAQHALIGDLERSRPPVIVFYGTGIGLPGWDGIEATVRHYDVSDYLLSHYQPWGVVDGQFLMVRTDLAATVPSPPPAAGVTPAAFYLANPTCDWGTAPDFLDVPAGLGSAPSVTARSAVSAPGATEIEGWAYDDDAGRAPVAVVAVRGGRVVASAVANLADPNGAAQVGVAPSAIIGFDVVVPEASGDPPVALYAMNADGTVSPLVPKAAVSPALVTTAPSSAVVGADGRSHPVSDASRGQVELATGGPNQITALALPAGTDLSAYHWLELSSTSRFGAGRYAIVAGNDAAGTLVSFRTLPRAGHHLYVQVGSCPQWRGLSAAGPVHRGPQGRGPSPHRAPGALTPTGARSRLGQAARAADLVEALGGFEAGQASGPAQGGEHPSARSLARPAGTWSPSTAAPEHRQAVVHVGHVGRGMGEALLVRRSPCPPRTRRWGAPSGPGCGTRS